MHRSELQKKKVADLFGFVAIAYCAAESLSGGEKRRKPDDAYRCLLGFAWERLADKKTCNGYQFETSRTSLQYALTDTNPVHRTAHHSVKRENLYATAGR